MPNLEHYVTPRWPVLRILKALDLPAGGRWLEPCVGGGSIVRSVEHYYPDTPSFNFQNPRTWTAVDIVHRGHPDTIVADFLHAPSFKLGQKFDVAIFNPPFSMAVRFAMRAMEFAPIVVMLQRLNWLASEERNDWLRIFTPDVYVLPNRPSFKHGRTDAQEYAWYVWHAQLYSGRLLDTAPHAPRLTILPTTPLSERDKGDDPSLIHGTERNKQ